MRLSFIWCETLLDLLDGAPAARPMPFLGDREGYAQRFAAAIEGGKPDAFPLEPPWHLPAGQFFWTHYLEGHTPGKIKGEVAWKQLVPFRRAGPFRARAPWLPGRIHAESFFYPHGIALVISAEVQGDLPLAAAVAKAHELRRTGKIEVRWDGKEAADLLGLDTLARRSLDALRLAALGPGAAEGALSPAFSVVTVVRATGVEPNDPTAEGGEIHRALQAMTTWNPSWATDALTKLEDARLPTRIGAPSHLLYGGRRGRVVWFPGLYTVSTVKLRSLACYQRNLTLASMQTESLAGLVLETESGRKLGKTPVGLRRECAQRAAGVLGRLYGGVASTYRSWSPRRQIEQNDYAKPLDSLRDFFNMPLLG
jgi:hypothetical protein